MRMLSFSSLLFSSPSPSQPRTFRLSSSPNSMSLVSRKASSFCFTNFPSQNEPFTLLKYCAAPYPKPITKYMKTRDVKTSDHPMEGSLSSGLPQLRYNLESMINASSKFFVFAVLTIVFFLTQDPEAMWAVAGCSPNILLSFTLKHIIKQERPFPSIKSGPGMPSSHAQFIFYIFIFVVRSIVQFLGINHATMCYAALTFSLGCYLSWLRVSQGFHTLSQVEAGAVIGSIFSVLWFHAWDAFVLEAMASNFLVRVLTVLGSAAPYILLFVGSAFHTRVIEIR